MVVVYREIFSHVSYFQSIRLTFDFYRVSSLFQIKSTLSIFILRLLYKILVGSNHRKNPSLIIETIVDGTRVTNLFLSVKRVWWIEKVATSKRWLFKKVQKFKNRTKLVIVPAEFSRIFFFRARMTRRHDAFVHQIEFERLVKRRCGRWHRARATDKKTVFVATDRPWITLLGIFVVFLPRTKN